MDSTSTAWKKLKNPCWEDKNTFEGKFFSNFPSKNLVVIIKVLIFAPVKNKHAEIAQLVEHNLAKVRVASSSLVFRSSLKSGCSNGGIGRHEGLKIPWPLRLCGFKSRFEYRSGC